MICKNCGATTPDESTFCANCGSPCKEEPAQNAAPVKQEPAAQAAPARTGGTSATKVMVFGIIGLALSEFGIPGLIFSIIALKLANAFKAEHGSVFGQAKVGRILATVGRIISIVMIVFWVIYFISCIIVLIFAPSLLKDLFYN